jgi:hypothetical protein
MKRFTLIIYTRNNFPVFKFYLNFPFAVICLWMPPKELFLKQRDPPYAS